MIHSVALVIADFLFSKDVITEEEKEVDKVHIMV